MTYSGSNDMSFFPLLTLSKTILLDRYRPLSCHIFCQETTNETHQILRCGFLHRSQGLFCAAKMCEACMLHIAVFHVVSDCMYAVAYPSGYLLSGSMPDVTVVSILVSLCRRLHLFRCRLYLLCWPDVMVLSSLKL